MTFKYTDYPIRGADFSKYDGVINWEKIANYPVHFGIIRAGYGRTTDINFLVNWKNSKRKIHRSAYWYMDYYSDVDMTDTKWGRYQAEYCWNLIKNDNDKGLVWLDIETGGSDYSPPILSVWDKAQAIAEGFLRRIDELSERTNGIYTSLSMTYYFDSWFKTRPIWLAWYNKNQNETTIKANLAVRKWVGKPLVWQYASDGDTDNDGVGNGLDMGVSRKIIDLDVWIASDDDWKVYSNNWEIQKPEPPEETKTMKLHFPLPEGIRISQIFGVNPQWYPSTKGHNGVDWACPVGTQIYAMEKGRVIRSDATSGKTGYGRHIRIQHEKGISIYGHLSKLISAVGDEVMAGQLIGLSGGATSDPASGYSTGPHLHGEYRLTDTPNPVPGGYNGNAIDILPLLISSETLSDVPLYGIQIIVPSLNVRYKGGTQYTILRTVTKGTVCKVYEEKDGWGRINPVQNEWVFLYPGYVKKITPDTPGVEKWQVTATAGLRIRRGPSTSTERIGVLQYGEIFEIAYAESGGWGKLYGRDGYCSLAYAIKL